MLSTTILFAAAIAISIFSFIIGVIVSATFDLTVRVSHKEDYEEKVKQFEGLIEDLENKLQDAEKPEEKSKYHPLDMFPANLARDYGLPRSLDEEE